MKMSSAEHNCPIIQACIEGHLDLLVELLKEGFSPNEVDSRGRTPLHLSASRGREDIIDQLLENGADIRAIDNAGNTALHYCGHIETIQIFLDKGANVFTRNKHGDTPVKLMKRRGVEKAAINLIREAMDEGDEVEGERNSLLRRRRTGTWKSRRGFVAVRNIWYEFCTDLGAERLIVVLLGVLLLSLYVAYTVTGLAKQIDTRIPVTEDSFKLEL